MSNRTGSRLAHLLIVTLYAVTFAFGAFGWARHAHWNGGAAVVSATATAKTGDCGNRAADHSQPGKPASSCCDACILSSAPIVAENIAHVVYAVEIATRLEFEFSLGRRLDRMPDDLRSRAPPLAV